MEFFMPLLNIAGRFQTGDISDLANGGFFAHVITSPQAEI